MLKKGTRMFRYQFTVDDDYVDVIRATSDVRALLKLYDHLKYTYDSRLFVRKLPCLEVIYDGIVGNLPSFTADLF